MPIFKALFLTIVIAALIDSCITSPNCPVKIYFPLPGITAVSTLSSSPPTSVQANPFTKPTVFSFSASPCLNLLTPRKSLRLFLSTLMLFNFLLSKSFLTTFLHILDISLSRFLTPASLVYDLIISINVFLLNFISFSVKPLFSNCFGIKYFPAIFSFSFSV